MFRTCTQGSVGGWRCEACCHVVLGNDVLLCCCVHVHAIPFRGTMQSCYADVRENVVLWNGALMVLLC